MCRSRNRLLGRAFRDGPVTMIWHCSNAQPLLDPMVMPMESPRRSLRTQAGRDRRKFFELQRLRNLVDFPCWPRKPTHMLCASSAVSAGIQYHRRWRPTAGAGWISGSISTSFHSQRPGR